MPKQADVVVVGGSAAGLTAAVTARRHYPDRSIMLIRQEEQVLIPCGIPYIFGTVGSPDKNLIPDAMLVDNGIDLSITRATEIDREKKVLQTADGDIGYDRLILATGSLPVRPPIPGIDLDGVYPILKDVEHLSGLQQRLRDAKKVVVIGGGFIGIEFADEINKIGGKEVTVVEIADRCLSLAYDDDLCIEMEAIISSRGVKIKTSTRVEAIEGNGRVESVRLSDGSVLASDVVILGIGACANVDLARKAGLQIGTTGGIVVDRMMKTSDPFILACGDCAEKASFFGGCPTSLKLASIATLEARVAGANLYHTTRETSGTVGVWSTAVGDFALGTAGLTESMARDYGYETISATVEVVNRHPGGMPAANKTKLKLVFEAETGVILGGQVRGDLSSGEMVNILSACVQKKMTAEDIATFQIGTHPALTASPIAYPLVNAAEMAIRQMHSQS